MIRAPYPLFNFREAFAGLGTYSTKCGFIAVRSYSSRGVLADYRDSGSHRGLQERRP